MNNRPTLWFRAHIFCRQNGMEIASVEWYQEEEQLEIELKKTTFAEKSAHMHCLG